MSNERNEQKRIVVIGIGNPYRGDDGAGVAVGRKISELSITGVTVMIRDGEAARLIESWNENDSVIVVDTVSSGQEPGVLMRFDAVEDPLPVKYFSHSSTHSFSLAEAVELARALDKLPARLVIYGIEGKNFDNGSEISSEVTAAIEEVTERIVRYIGSIRGQNA